MKNCNGCTHNRVYQAGGGWTDRDFVFCGKINQRIYTDPPIADISDAYPRMLLPLGCPNGVIQLSLFDLNQSFKICPLNSTAAGEYRALDSGG